ncbi:FkbM family methyltransferase [Leptospira perolatii]|uniref:FkbM family methyltransferase n=1 Tax=Leptospira perolatii TaxID=2023191 RepID=UPI003C6DB1EA
MIRGIKRLFFKLGSIAFSLLRLTTFGRGFLERILVSLMRNKATIVHNDITLTFAVPNQMNYFRIETFSSKEPETLEWIDAIPKNSILWDIGANVGLYTCYAIKSRNCKVYCFEPSVFNVELLARNIFMNNLVSKAVIVPLPLTSIVTESSLNMSSTDWGMSLSSFGQSYGHDGKELNKQFEFKTIGISMDQCITLLNLPSPDYIKMDVDGIEHLILKGGKKVLRKVKGIIIEINEEFEEQKKQSVALLKAAGLKFKEKRHADKFENGEFRNTYNQIWVR